MEDISEKENVSEKYLSHFPYKTHPVCCVHTPETMNSVKQSLYCVTSIVKYSVLQLPIWPCGWANQKKELEEVQKSESGVGDGNIMSSTTHPP